MSSRTIEAPGRDCPLCPRLVAFREAQRRAFPTWHNAPVASLGPAGAPLLIVGLAPGLRGANRTGRPFTGDFAGEVLYPALIDRGLARGRFAADPGDGLELIGCRIANAVRCVPPANRPTPAEIRSCRPFLAAEVASAPPRAILALGRIAHDTVLRSHGLVPARVRFAHGAEHRLGRGRWLIASYHTSRYNMNTGRLTAAMFAQALETAVRLLDVP